MRLLNDEQSSLLFDKIEQKAIYYLNTHDEDYQSLMKEKSDIIDKYHNMLNFLEYNKPIALSEEEHGVMIHYIEIENRINDMVKFMMYLCGHADCSSYQQIMDELREIKDNYMCLEETEETIS